jgi:predicted Fe-Mo cluster-binding NifX family protein
MARLLIALPVEAAGPLMPERVVYEEIPRSFVICLPAFAGPALPPTNRGREVMRIAIVSQNFREITGHAGHARRFRIFEVDAAMVTEVDRLDLPRELTMHGFDDRQAHPLDDMDVLITAGAGDGFVQRLARRGVRVVTTSETDPEVAVHAFLAGCLKAAGPHLPHDHGGNQDSHCGCHH